MATRMGYEAVQVLAEGKTNRVICVRDDQIVNVDIDEGLAMKKDPELRGVQGHDRYDRCVSHIRNRIRVSHGGEAQLLLHGLCAKSVDGHRILWFVIGNFSYVPSASRSAVCCVLRRTCLFCQKCSSVIVHFCRRTLGVHGLKSYLIIQDIHGILSRTPHGAHGLKFIVLTQVQSGRVAASPTAWRKNVPKECCPNESLLISSKMLLHLSKNGTQSKEHRYDVESGELIGYTEALSVLQDACSPDMRREVGLDFDIDADKHT